MHWRADFHEAYQIDLDRHVADIVCLILPHRRDLSDRRQRKLDQLTKCLVKNRWSIPSTTATGGSRKIWRERQLLEKTWLFREAPKGKSEMLKPDNYEFPFDIVLDGSLAESIEGLYDTWVTYRFKAEVGRKYSKDLVARKPLRIIRTLDPSALELSHAMVCSEVAPGSWRSRAGELTVTV